MMRSNTLSDDSSSRQSDLLFLGVAQFFLKVTRLIIIIIIITTIIIIFIIISLFNIDVKNKVNNYNKKLIKRNSSIKKVNNIYKIPNDGHLLT